MLSSGQYLQQKQSLQQRLSPQQIQYIKLLQLPTLALEQRVKEELESNPLLEEDDGISSDSDEFDEETSDSEEVDAVDENEEIDWEEYLHGDERESYKAGSYNPDQDWHDLPNPYHKTMFEELENQINLLDLNDKEKLIADQILGSIDEDGYFRRDIDSLVDSIAFNNAVSITEEEVLRVLKKIQRLDPVGIAARNLRECLLIQLETLPDHTKGKKVAYRIIDEEWDLFEKKHFDKIKKHLHASDEEMREAYECIQSLDPKPGTGDNDLIESSNYIIPDFEVYYEPEVDEYGNEKEEGDFVISLNDRNAPSLRISPHYKKLWDKTRKSKSEEAKETRSFIKGKMESAQWFIESIIQRQQTLLNVMRTIVALQEDFFKYGQGLKPMILKDIADRINMDISTISRVVNGKYVQTNFGIYELKYFFNEGVETESGEEVSNRAVKNLLLDIIEKEDKSKPLSDQALTNELKKEGYKIARRTVSKYREQLNIPVARLRKQVI